MWLTLARDYVGSDGGWVQPLYDSAFNRANDEERRMALLYLEERLREPRN